MGNFSVGRHYLRRWEAYYAIVGPAISADLPIERPCVLFRRVVADRTSMTVILSVLHRTSAAAVMPIQYALHQGLQMAMLYLISVTRSQDGDVWRTICRAFPFEATGDGHGQSSELQGG